MKQYMFVLHDPKGVPLVMTDVYLIEWRLNKMADILWMAFYAHFLEKKCFTFWLKFLQSLFVGPAWQ